MDGIVQTQSYDATLGVQFGSRIFAREGLQVKAMVWDTAGQQSFRSIIRSYYRSAIVAILVFDCTNTLSFESIPRWLSEIEQHGNPLMRVVLVGNKIDLEHRRVVHRKEIDKLVNERHMAYWETSAKTGVNVGEAFMQVADGLIRDIEEKRIVLGSVDVGIKLGSRDINNGDGVEVIVKKKNEEDKCRC